MRLLLLICVSSRKIILPLCRGDSNPTPFHRSFSRLDLFRLGGRRKEKTAGQAGDSQYSHVGRTAASAGNRAGDGGEDFANAQVVWPVQERGRFAGRSRARGEAPRKNAQISDCGKTEFQKCGASNGMLRPRETQGAPRKITDQNFCTTSAFANRWASRRATTLDAEGKSRFLASLGMTDGSGSCVLDHKVWCVGLGWSMRRGTWSAMRMP